MAEPVELGFLEKAERPAELTSPFLPSKVGGKPAWLDPANLPRPEDIACSVCGVPRTFLLQIYAPLPETPSAFHRTFFLFVCLNSSCHQRNDARGFRVFRCQLPKDNPFYDDNSESSEDESTSNWDHSCDVSFEQQPLPQACESTHSVSFAERSDSAEQSSSSSANSTAVGEVLEASTVCVEKSIAKSVGDLSPSEASEGRECDDGGVGGVKPASPLCIVCGSAGPKKCSKCRLVHYCSREHQTHDWKKGHKLFCSDLSSGKCTPNEMTYDPSHGVTLPEFEVVTEEEPAVAREGQAVGERGEEERMREYYKFVQSGRYRDHSRGEGGKLAKKEVEKADSGAKSDKVFKAFRRRVVVEPEQVIRYQRRGQPLLVSQDSTPQPADITPCACGADRQFEFQVMPQLLYYLKLDVLSEATVDWGTVLVYSCTASCLAHNAGTAARCTTELVWKQDFSTHVS